MRHAKNHWLLTHYFLLYQLYSFTALTWSCSFALSAILQWRVLTRRIDSKSPEHLGQILSNKYYINKTWDDIHTSTTTVTTEICQKTVLEIMANFPPLWPLTPRWNRSRVRLSMRCCRTFLRFLYPRAAQGHVPQKDFVQSSTYWILKTTYPTNLLADFWWCLMILFGTSGPWL